MECGRGMCVLKVMVSETCGRRVLGVRTRLHR